MKKKKRLKNKNNSQNVEKNQIQVQDAYSNPLANLGAGADNLAQNVEYPIERKTFDYQTLNSLYRNDWVAGKVIDIVAQDMVKMGIELESEEEPEYIQKFEKYIGKINLKSKILEGLKWGRLYGGAVGVIIIKGQEDRLHKPLDLENIWLGDFKGLLILDRWTGIQPSLTLVENINSTDFGLPKYYKILSGYEQTDDLIDLTVHHSRVVRFTGRELPKIEKISNMYWGMSELERIYYELNKKNNLGSNIESLSFRANLIHRKIDNYEQIINGGNPRVINAFEAQNKILSNNATLFTGVKDELNSLQFSGFDGLDSVYQSFMLDVAGACEIPATRLFGRSPQGMNATGESDLQMYYESIREKQEIFLKPIWDKLLPIIFLSCWGFVPDNYDYSFAPIRQPSEEERKNLAQNVTGSIINAFQSGLISQKVALKELKQSSSYSGMWTNITDEDINNADDIPTEGETDPLGFGGGGMNEEEGMEF